ncbi:MAG TPA: translocation/assembly module TamB domain-containing protein [Candidatus Angelobacter sp.]|nr:translocation/assembly module TamB domain-containing protein [Candidatus Angelobacter sp.]
MRIFRRSGKARSSKPVTAKQQKAPRTRRAKWVRRICYTALLVMVVVLGLYLKATLPEQVRRRVVNELELMTGGKVEIQSLAWKLSKLQFDIHGLTIHGRESAGQAPYIHVDHLFLQVRFSSLFSRAIRLEYVSVEHPAIHLIVNPDGTTNQPGPAVTHQDSTSAAQLFALAVNHFDVSNGELLLNERVMPFQFAAERVTASMAYSVADKTYDGSVSLALSTPGQKVIGQKAMGQKESRSKNGLPLQGDLDLHFLLHPTSAEIKSLSIRVEHSTLVASGSVANYSRPEIHLKYDTSIDLPRIFNPAKGSGVQAGHLDASGTAVYLDGKYALEGNAAIHDLGWRNATFHVSRVEMSSPFSLTPEKILLPKLMIHALGGHAQGEAQISDWNAPEAGRKFAPVKSRIALQVSGVQVRDTIFALSSSSFPLDKASLTGSMVGDVNISWTGDSSNLVAALKLDVNPPANPAASQVPLTARLQATYYRNPERLDVAGLNAATRDMRLNAVGTLGQKNTRLKVGFNANDLRELQPVLDAFSLETQVSVAVYGRASFNGTIFGKLSQPSATGHLDIANFDTLVHSALLPGAGGTTAKPKSGSMLRAHWDSAIADVIWTPSQLSAQNGALYRGPTQIGFSGSVNLNRGRFDSASSQIMASLRVQNTNLADIKSLTGSDWPLTGVLNGSVRVTGTLRNLNGSGRIQASQLTIYSEPFRSLRADISFGANQLSLSHAVLLHNGSQVNGSFDYNFMSQTAQFDLKGAGVDLAELHRWQPPRVAVAGKADFHFTGGGTFAAPALSGQIDFHHLVLNGDPVGDLHATVETQGADMQLQARSSFQNATFFLDGAIHLRESFPAQLTLRFEQLNLDPLIHAYYQDHLKEHVTVAGHIDVNGPLSSPHDLTINSNIDQLAADIENIKIQNDGPLRFALSSQSLRVDQFHLTGPDLDVSLLGNAMVGAPRTLALRANGKMNLKVLQGFSPGLSSSGAATFTIAVQGTMAQPKMRGRIEVINGALSEADLPNGLSQINGHLVFAQDHVQIEELTAHTGGGELTLGGFIAYRNGLYFDVTASGKDVRLRYPPGISASADARLRYTGSAQSSLLSGEVTILRFAMNPRFDFAQYLARSKSALSSSAQNPFLDNMRLDVHVVSTPELRVETSLAKLSGDANLRIRGTAASPGVLGRVNIAQGDVSFNGTKYHLERGDVTFSNPLVIQPVIDLEMSARVRDYEITIGFHGSFEHLNVTYRSDPPLPSSDIIALLAFGRTRQETVYATRQSQVDAPSAVVLDQALSSASSSRVQKIFGVGRIKIDPQAAGPENNPSTRVTIEQQINNNITLTYLTNVAQSQSQQVIQVEYNINRNLSIVAVRDQNGILGFDVHFRQRKK